MTVPVSPRIQGSESRTVLRLPISVVIMTKNEERVLRQTLASVADFGQVFVVDSHSKDRTRSIAKEAGAEIVDFTWNGEYPKKKEWCLDHLSFAYDWVLYLDADECVTPHLAAELSAIFSLGTPEHVAYDVELDYYFLGKKLRHGHRVTKRVLSRRDRMTWPRPDDLGVANMWEVEGHYQPVVDGTVGRLRGRLEHNDRDPLYDYFARHNRYSDWEAHLLSRRDLAESVRSARSSRGRRYAWIPFKPLAFFLYSYVARLGFLDGRAGFHYAVAHSFYFWQIGIKSSERPTITRSVRVVQAIASLSPADGGPTTAAICLNSELRRLGVQATLVATDAVGKGRLEDEEIRRLLSDAEPSLSMIICRRSAPFFFKNSWKQGVELFRAGRSADVFHIHGIYLANSVWTFVSSKFWRVPYVIQPHGTLEPYQRQFSQTKKRIFDAIIGKRILSGASALVAASPSEGENLSQLVPEAKIEILPLGFTITDANRPKHSTTEINRWLSAPESKRVIFLGRLASKKQPDLLLRAWNSVSAEAQLLVVGAECDWTRNDLMKLIHPDRLQSVAFMDHVPSDEAQWLLGQARIFVLPSENENFGISLVEAMAAGCAIVASTETGSLPHAQRVNGAVALTSLEPRRLIGVLDELLSNETLTSHMGERNRRYAGEQLTWAKSAETLLSIYHSVAAN